MNKESLGDRIKAYEAAHDYSIMRRCPVIIRLDGRSFHSVTKKLDKPSSEMMTVMASTMLDVAKDTEGCVFGYTQSDEITFVLKNDQSLLSKPWFDNRVQKMVSVIAAETTYYFNKHADKEGLSLPKATFDARVFTVPNLTEVVNVLIWRQRDCMKNAISLAVDTELRKKYSKKDTLKLLHGKKSKERIQIMYDECGIDFYKDYLPGFIKGVACYKKTTLSPVRTIWIRDWNIPEFAKDPAVIVNSYDFDRDGNDVSVL